MEEDEEKIEGGDGRAVEDHGRERVSHCHGGRTKRLRPIQLNQIREREGVAFGEDMICRDLDKVRPFGDSKRCNDRRRWISDA